MPRVSSDWFSLPEALQQDIQRWTKTSAPMPDVEEIKMCGCREGEFGQVFLCQRHEGFLAALDIGYHDGYVEALGAADRVDRKNIAGQAPFSREDLASAVKVPLWTVIFAVRYGISRHSYACADAGRLAYNMWDQLPIHAQDQIRRDAEHIDPVYSGAWEWLRKK